MYCHSLKTPAKYHDNRLDIFYVGSFFISYAILPRLPLFRVRRYIPISFVIDHIDGSNAHKIYLSWIGLPTGWQMDTHEL